MNLHPLDLVIIAVYLLGVAMVGVLVRKRATKKLDSFYLADRNIPWWMLGLSGCSSYIDIGGTMSHDRAHLLRRAQVDVGDPHLLGLVHHRVLHGLPGQVHPPLRGHDLRRVERDAFRDGEGRRGGPAGGGDLPAGADDLQPDVHQRRHGQVRRGVPAPAALGGDAHRPRRRGRVCDAGRLLRRHPDRHLPDAAHRRRRGHHGRHGLRQAGGGDLHPEGAGLVLAQADLDAVVGIRGGDAAGLPAFRPVRPAHGGGLLLDDLPRPQRPERLGLPVLPDDAVAARRPAGRRDVDGRLQPALGPGRELHGPGHLLPGEPGGLRRREDHAAGPAEDAGRAARPVHGRAAGGPDVDDQRHDQRDELGRHQRFRQALRRQEPDPEAARAAGADRLGRGRPRRVRLLALLHQHRHGLGDDGLRRGHGHPGAGDLEVALLAVRGQGLRLEHGRLGRPHLAAPDLREGPPRLGLAGHRRGPGPRDDARRGRADEARRHGGPGQVLCESAAVRVLGPGEAGVREEGLVPAHDKMPKIDMLNGFVTAAFQFSLAILPFYLFMRNWRQLGLWAGAAAAIAVVLYFTWYKNLPAKDEI
ncbi:MAG: hypothetical protein MZV63_58815 [Marinilabiliales bacterium]|nr:hypothetical protein [Marinilabiliales bacterium]